MGSSAASAALFSAASCCAAVLRPESAPQRSLCPFHAATWHLRPQYHSTLHLEQRCSAGFPHIAHFGSSSICSMLIASYIAASSAISARISSGDSLVMAATNARAIVVQSLWSSFVRTSGICSMTTPRCSPAWGGFEKASVSTNRRRSDSTGSWSMRSSLKYFESRMMFCLRCSFHSYLRRQSSSRSRLFSNSHTCASVLVTLRTSSGATSHHLPSVYAWGLPLMVRFQGLASSSGITVWSTSWSARRRERTARGMALTFSSMNRRIVSADIPLENMILLLWTARRD
mmetsp:Transcript_24117/g.57491  ORF Transcript_24117/g.57491 Transcript_24117/m.57491 type:complete len:287 (-) Transcript_24117:630-1490(-)